MELSTLHFLLAESMIKLAKFHEQIWSMNAKNFTKNRISHRRVLCGPANEIKLQKLNEHLNQMNAYLTQCVLIIHKIQMWIIHGWVVSRFRSWHKGNLTLQLGVVIIWCDNLKMAKNCLISQLVCHYKTLYVKGASRMHNSRWIYKVHLCMIL